MLDEILKESWTYQEIFQKGYVQGLKAASDLELQHWIEQERETVIKFVQMRFPEILPFTQSHIESLHGRITLHALLNKLIAIAFQASDEAKQAIIDASTAETSE